MKRKNEEMQGELSALRQLYDFLRVRPEHDAQDVLRRIRSTPAGASASERIQELADFVRHADFNPQSSPPLAVHRDAEKFTLPPLRIALDSHALGDSSTFPGNMLSTDFGAPSSQRRRHTSDADVSAR
jgi:hypothetical protein